MLSVIYFISNCFISVVNYTFNVIFRNTQHIVKKTLKKSDAPQYSIEPYILSGYRNNLSYKDCFLVYFNGIIKRLIYGPLEYY
jgi:hypothetical protein